MISCFTVGDSFDISFYAGKTCTDEQKYQQLKNRWQPSLGFKFPASEPRNLKFQQKWFAEYPWLAYSLEKDGAYCLFCCLFSFQTVGKGSHMNLKSLVCDPFSRWKDAKEQFKHHQDTTYHKNATVSAQNFIDVQEKKNQ